MNETVSEEEKYYELEKKYEKLKRKYRDKQLIGDFNASSVTKKTDKTYKKSHEKSI